MLNRIHSPQDCLSSLWDKSFLQERGIASFFLTEKNTFENTPLFVNPEKPDVPLNKNDAFQKVQKRRVQEKR